MTLALINGMRAVLVACALMLATAVIDAQDFPNAVIVGGESTYVVRPGDTVTAIAGHFGMSASALIALNRLPRPNAVAPGQTLLIDNPHLAVVDPTRTITINVAQRMLFLVDDGGVTGYPITVGQRGWPTPLGPFTIVDKERNPAWDVPESIQREMQAQGKPVITRMEPSPDNPLGDYWLRLSLPAIGIHGTNAPSSIYRYASHGCIRMHPDDVAALFDRVGIGTTGVIVYQPALIAEIDGRVMLEVHPDPYRRVGDAAGSVRDAAEEQGIAGRIDWMKVDAVLRARAGRPEDVTATRTTR
jgi:L,D-transpeptidase ErfK/SrfK